MDYVLLLRWRQGLTRDQRDGALMRRAEWRYPEGIDVVAEYWPATEDPAVVVIARTEDFSSLMEIQFTWGDVFELTAFPAISAEEGLRVGPEVMARRQV